MTDLNTAPFGVIGLATMGRNLCLNLLGRDHRVAVWNLEPELTRALVDEYDGDGLIATDSLSAFLARLARPRRILMMIRAGSAVDEIIETLRPMLSPGDILIDGGNSRFQDTERRCNLLATSQVDYVGMGVSGGEHGARHGPSLMFGGSLKAWNLSREILESIAAQSNWGPCVARLGGGGAGHFVKMIHNGIEYGDMQLIAETYDLFRRGQSMSAAEISQLFTHWDKGPLSSFLTGLTATVLSRRDDRTGSPLVDMIMDKAEQKGTGRWTVEQGLQLGVAIPTIAASVDARVLSSLKEQRSQASAILPETEVRLSSSVEADTVEKALLAAKLCTYAQGFQLLAVGSKAYRWEVNLADTARVWTGGCIIRARLLDDIIGVFTEHPTSENLLLHDPLLDYLNDTLAALRQVVSLFVTLGIPAPAFSASLAWYDGLSSKRLPQNLIQAQRDAFGAHTYQRTDEPLGKPRHTQWQD